MAVPSGRNTQHKTDDAPNSAATQDSEQAIYMLRCYLASRKLNRKRAPVCDGTGRPFCIAGEYVH